MKISRSKITTPMLMRIRNLPAYLADPAISPLRKGALALALLYIISPLDALPDVIPVVGWLDDIGVLGLLVTTLMRDLDGYVPARRGTLAK